MTAAPALDELRAVAALHAATRANSLARNRRSAAMLAELARSAYAQGATLADIGRALGVSRQRVFQIVNQQPRTEDNQ